MSGYVHFTPTGVEAIDAILAAMTRAGNMFHHTAQWQDPYPTDDDPSPLESIQQAANDAAKTLAPTSPVAGAPEGRAACHACALGMPIGNGVHLSPQGAAYPCVEGGLTPDVERGTGAATAVESREEMEALRAEVWRLRDLIDRAAGWLEPDAARSLRAASYHTPASAVEAASRGDVERVVRAADWRRLHAAFRELMVSRYGESGCERAADDLCEIVAAVLRGAPAAPSGAATAVHPGDETTTREERKP